MRATWIVAAAAFALAACDSGSGAGWVDGQRPAPDDHPPAVVDADLDGVPADRDCDDADPSAWTTGFAYVDADGDGHGAGPLREVCAGSTQPRGWSYDALDCDDAAPSVWQARTLHADDDHDGVGEGRALEVCSADVPFGYAVQGGDCAPGDGLRWRTLEYRSRDADLDLHFVTTTGTACAGAWLPPGYSPDVSFSADDCDDADPAAWRAVTAYRDEDGDGAGAGSPVARCAGDALASGWASTAGDCADDDRTRWQLRFHAGIDRDGDGVTVPLAGSLCAGAALPEPYRAAERGVDCDDGAPARWQRQTAYADLDGDGVGSGPGHDVCAGASLPAGLSAVAGDCAPLDPAAWGTLTYAFRDADGDGRAVRSSGTICAGAALPPGYLNVAPVPFDCDDARSAVWASVVAYVDADRDGAGEGDAVTLCTTGVVPAGYAAAGGDCAAGDGTRWRLASYAGLDEDGDGVTTRAPGQVCAGATLPDPYRATAAGNDCDDDDGTRYRWVVLYRDLDGDGVGAGPRSIPCLGSDIPAGWSTQGFDPDDTSSAAPAGDDAAALLLEL